VFYATADAQADGDVQAALLMTSGRSALNGQVIASDGVANPYTGEFPGGKTEHFIAAHAGKYLYGQAWAIEQVID
jgi:hypothetical protein